MILRFAVRGGGASYPAGRLPPLSPTPNQCYLKVENADNACVPEAKPEETESTLAFLNTLSYLIFVFKARALISHLRPVQR